MAETNPKKNPTPAVVGAVAGAAALAVAASAMFKHRAEPVEADFEGEGGPDTPEGEAQVSLSEEDFA
ncbi:hypothetical protein OG401_37705 [Kitasatospora purpeofusca]|uniref:hypothetical protein n=1 Tax=Kitasatospora purpeofusca TaxID=67352 RepID=UPI0022590B19|nr:hypothetical protein [Kitasatospora purpeofusca]MCX4689965.1 hypothetical protein [Kitasatospora purpeofusca]